MAQRVSLYRRGETWWYDFTIELATRGPGGTRRVRRYRGSTGVSDRVEAERKATLVRSVIDREQEEILRRKAAGISEKPRIEITLAQALARYMKEHAEPNCKCPAQMGGYNKALLRYFKPDTLLSDIDYNGVVKFRMWLTETRTTKRRGATKQLAARTLNAYCNHLRFVMNRARDLWGVNVQKIRWGTPKSAKGVLLLEPKAPMLVLQNAPVDFPTIYAAVQEDMLPLFRFSLRTSTRQENAYSLMKPAVEWPLRRIRFMQKSKTPGGMPHYVPITAAIEKLLAECWEHDPNPNGAVFTYICRKSQPKLGIREGRRYPMTARVLRNRWDELRKKVGVPDLTWHRIRATAATYYLEKTGNETLVMALTGHHDERSFKRYTASFGALAQVAAMIDAFDIEADLARLRHNTPLFAQPAQTVLPPQVPALPAA
jgi:integrase